MVDLSLAVLVWWCTWWVSVTFVAQNMGHKIALKREREIIITTINIREAVFRLTFQYSDLFKMKRHKCKVTCIATFKLYHMLQGSICKLFFLMNIHSSGWQFSVLL